jgi:hypothetical protein
VLNSRGEVDVLARRSKLGKSQSWSASIRVIAGIINIYLQ